MSHCPDTASSEMYRLHSLCAEQGKQLTARQAEIDALKKQLAIAELKNKGTLANNLCPDCRDKQVGKPCLACAIQTLEAKLQIAVDSLRRAGRCTSKAEVELVVDDAIAKIGAMK